MRWNFSLLTIMSCVVFAGSWSTAQAVGITAEGNVEAVDVSQMESEQILVYITFDENPDVTPGDPIPLDLYAEQDFMLNVGNSLQDILPNAQANSGAIPTPVYSKDVVVDPLFQPNISQPPLPQQDPFAQNVLVATFTRPDVYQVGAVVNNKNTQYITAFAFDGTIIGQLKYEPIPLIEPGPGFSAWFVGLRTLNKQPIAMVTYGVSDLLNGEVFSNDVPEAVYASDHWVFGVTSCDFSMDPPCDDGNICTLDQCQPGSLNICMFEKIEGCCVTDQDCNGNEVCDLEQNVCVPDNETDTSTSESDSNSDSGTSASESDSDSESASESATESDTVMEVESLTSDSIGLALDDDGCEFCQSSPVRGNLAGMLGMLGLLYFYGGVRRRKFERDSLRKQA